MLVHLLPAVPLDGNVGHPLGLRLLLVLTHPRPTPPLLPALSPQTGLPGIRLHPTWKMHVHAGGPAPTPGAAAAATANQWVEGVVGFEEKRSSCSWSGRGGGNVGGLEAAVRGGGDGVIDDEVEELARGESV